MNEYRVTITYADGDTDAMWVAARSEGMACLLVGVLLGEELFPKLQRFIKSVSAVIETN